MTEAQRSARIISVFLFLLFSCIYSSCAEVARLHCQRSDGQCLLTRETVLRKQEVTIPLADLLGAHEEGTHSSAHNNGGHTVLDTRKGPIPFETWMSNNMVHISGEVQDFVRHPQQQDLDETHDSRLDVLGAACFLLIGSLLFLGVSFLRGLRSTSGTGR